MVTRYTVVQDGQVYEPAKIPSDIERIDAQVTYTAMMTNTLLTEE